jgi:hypothetical protein
MISLEKTAVAGLEWSRSPSKDDSLEIDEAGLSSLSFVMSNLIDYSKYHHLQLTILIHTDRQSNILHHRDDQIC